MNPDGKQFKTMGGSELAVRGWLVGNNAIMWPAINGMHMDYASINPKVLKNGIPVIAHFENKVWVVNVTRSVLNTTLAPVVEKKPDPIITTAKNHPIWKKLKIRMTFLSYIPD